MKIASWRALVVCVAISAAPPVSGQAPKTRHVIFVMTDGFRWQETFRGAEATLMTKENGVGEPERLKAEFWRESAEERRKALLPFLWTEIARRGQIYGNRDRESDAVVANGLNFSYPGYSEA